VQRLKLEVELFNDNLLIYVLNTESASQGLKNGPFFRKRAKTLNPEMVLKIKSLPSKGLAIAALIYLCLFT